jgi:Fe-S-cluster containining protein
MDFRIFPVEYKAIERFVEKTQPPVNSAADHGQCPFLIDGACSVYSHRPVICRTHGLPLLSMGDEEWELNHCELNFTDGETEFTTENCLITDRINSRLFMLNREYLGSENPEGYSEFDLLPLSSLAKGGGK